MTQPVDLITQALIDIGAAAPGEAIDADDTNFAFTLLRQMLDSWWNESQMVFFKSEVIHPITTGVSSYTIGNGGDVSCTFAGSSSGTVLTVTSTSWPGALSVGMVLPNGAQIVSYGTGRGGSAAAAIGTYNISTSANPLASGSYTAYAQRPLKINSAFVRVVNSATGTLDYPVSVINVEKWELIGIKTLPGPWPRALYYQPSMPYGVLNYWPNPTQGEMHLFCDPVPTQYATLLDVMVLPQGWELCVRSNLALLLMPGYGTINQMQAASIAGIAKSTRANLKRTNMAPIQDAQFDDAILPGRSNDAGWILTGGF